ncbi:hypothetical protein F5Y06DRAFT_278292 [Hypoxylon sp. FL0890]|nr:hypothetical protein F5Y06DRAFT_278292 [Hypoxylon sp. FL0890]
MFGSQIPVRNRPNSRITLKPKREQPRPAPNDGTGQQTMDLFMYVKNLPKAPGETAKQSVANLLGTDLHSRMGERSIGLGYDIGTTTHVYGNFAAANLLEEFDDTIDYARSLEDARSLEGVEGPDLAMLRRRVTEDLGEEFVENRSLESIIGILLLFAKGYMMARARNLCQYSYFDFGHNFSKTVWRENDTKRELMNSNLHTLRAEEDMLWCRSPHINRNHALFTDTRDWQQAHYECLYRIRLNECAAITRHAADPNNANKANFFSWALNFINKFTGWRHQILEVFGRRRHQLPPAYFPSGPDWLRLRRYLSDRWRDRGGYHIDALYEDWLHQLFRVLEAVERGAGAPSPALRNAYYRDRDRLVTAINTAKAGRDPILDEEDKAYVKRVQQLTAENQFPTDIPVEANAPRPVIPYEFVPESDPVEFPRQPLEPSDRYFIVVIPRQPGIAGMHPPPVGGPPPPPGGGPTGGMARAISGGYDSFYDEETEPETEDEDAYYYYDSTALVDLRRGSTPRSAQRGSYKPYTPGKRVSFADEAAWGGIKLAPPPKRTAPAGGSVGPPAKRPRRMAVSE